MRRENWSEVRHARPDRQAHQEPMNVCMIAYAVYESDSRLLCYTNTLAELGHSVDVIAVKGEKGLAPPPTKGVRIYRIHGQKYAGKARLGHLYGILAFFCRATLLVSQRELAGHYDVVHVHSVPDNLIFCALLPKLRGSKLILDIHDVLPEFYISKFNSSETSLMYRLLLWLERACATFADYVIAANDIWRAKLVSRSVPVSKCEAILSVPDRTIFRRSGKTRSDGKTIILYPGTLSWHQGLDIAIRGFARIANIVPEAEFHIYGSGPEQEMLCQLVDELGLGSRVKFNAPRTLWEIARIMENADVGIVPKRDDVFGNEAFSTKTLEFMAMGVPVVISGTKIDRCYLDESIVEFFTPGDEQSLANALLAVITDVTFRKTLAERALQFVAKNDWENNKDKYLNILSRLVGDCESK
jgi:glycosyltransferase involved in cell wall biosynthesis